MEEKNAFQQPEYEFPLAEMRLFFPKIRAPDFHEQKKKN